MKKKSEKVFSTPQGAPVAGFVDPKTVQIPLDKRIQAVKESHTGDDAFLGLLVWNYERDAVQHGKIKALQNFFSSVDSLHREGVLSKKERELIVLAEAAGDVDEKTLISESKYLRAVQELVKANAEVIRLPFIQNAMITMLRAQKYGSKPLYVRDKWSDFLHKRPKKKTMHSTESLRRLLRAARDSKVKAIDAPAIIGKGLGISEDSIKKLTREKGGKPGRPKKSK